mgnify:CR=1 FL=1
MFLAPRKCRAESRGKTFNKMNKYEYKLTFAGRRVIKKTIEADGMRAAWHIACLDADSHGTRCLSVAVEKIMY